MSGNIVAGAAVSVNTTSSIALENTSAIFSKWSGRGMEFIRNIPAQMQQSNAKAFAVIFAANAFFLIVMKYTLLPVLDRYIEEKNDDTKNQRLTKKSLKVIVVGTLLVGLNLSFAKLARYPLRTPVLSTVVASVLIGYFIFGKASATPATPPVETPEAIAARLSSNATRLEAEETAERNTVDSAIVTTRMGELDAAQTAVTQAQQTLDQADANAQNLWQEHQNALRSFSGVENTIRSTRQERSNAIAAVETARAILVQTIQNFQGDLATLRQTLTNAELAERNSRTELEQAQERHQAPHDASQDSALADAVQQAEQAVQQAEQATANARIPLQEILDIEAQIIALGEQVDQADQRLQEANQSYRIVHDRIQRAQQAVENLPNMADLELAVTNAIERRDAAQQALIAATTANIEAQAARERENATKAAIPATPASPTTLPNETAEQIAEHERLKAEENLLEIEADAAHTHATYTANALNFRQQQLEEAQEAFTQAARAIEQTSRAIAQAVIEQQEAEQVLIAAREADRIDRTAFGQMLSNLDATRDALASQLATSGRNLSNVKQELADAIATENTLKEKLRTLMLERAANQDQSQNASFALAVQGAREAVRQAEEARAIPQSIVNIVEHLSAAAAAVGDGEQRINQTGADLVAAVDRFRLAQDAVRNQPNIDALQQALNDARIARDAAQVSLIDATRANDAAQEAALAARENVIAASAARERTTTA